MLLILARKDGQPVLQAVSVQHLMSSYRHCAGIKAADRQRLNNKQLELVSIGTTEDNSERLNCKFSNLEYLTKL